MIGHDNPATVVPKSLMGTGPHETRLGWLPGTLELADQRIGMTLPAVSITVLEILGNSAAFDSSLKIEG
jgi:hypothetical protein